MPHRVARAGKRAFRLYKAAGIAPGESRTILEKTFVQAKKSFEAFKKIHDNNPITKRVQYDLKQLRVAEGNLRIVLNGIDALEAKQGKTHSDLEKLASLYAEEVGLSYRIDYIKKVAEEDRKKIEKSRDYVKELARKNQKK